MDLQTIVQQIDEMSRKIQSCYSDSTIHNASYISIVKVGERPKGKLRSSFHMKVDKFSLKRQTHMGEGTKDAGEMLRMISIGVRVGLVINLHFIEIYRSCSNLVTVS